MANWYVSSVKYAAIPVWAASTAYSLGDYVRRLTGDTGGNGGRVFKCTTAGTTGGTEPTWNVGNNATTTSGTAVFTQVAGQEAEQSAGNWKCPIGTLAGAASLVSSTGEVIFVASDHLESYASATTVTGTIPPRYSCDPAAITLPPVSSDLQKGATVETTGNNGLTLNNDCLFSGFIFKAATGGTTAAGNFNINGSGTYENCELHQNNTSASTNIVIGSAATSRGSVEFSADTKVYLNNASQSVTLVFSELLWRDTASPLVSGSQAPTTIMNMAAANGSRGIATCRNIDFSGFSSTASIASFSGFGDFLFENCKLPASFTVTSSIPRNNRNNSLRLHNCHTDAGPINYNSRERGTSGGYEVTTSLKRTSGATDGVTPISWKVDPFGTTPSNDGFAVLLPRIAKRINDTVSKTFTVHAIFFDTSAQTLPKRDKLFCEFSIANNAGTTRQSLLSTRSGNLDTSDVQSDTSADWTSGLSDRTNSTTVLTGAFFKVASAPNKVFRVRTGGGTAASEPAAYATCVDGDQITDGAAVITVGNRLKFSVTTTPAVKAVITASVKAALTSGAEFYIDPKIEVS